jgi:hypothetical protein
MLEMTSELKEFKDVIDGSAHPITLYDTDAFGKNYKHTIPLFCAENNYKCMYQPSKMIYIIFNGSGDSRWEEV